MFVVHPRIYLFFPACEGLGRMLSLVLTLSETMCVTGDLVTRQAGWWRLPGERGLYGGNLALSCLR